MISRSIFDNSKFEGVLVKRSKHFRDFYNHIKQNSGYKGMDGPLFILWLNPDHTKPATS